MANPLEILLGVKDLFSALLPIANQSNYTIDFDFNSSALEKAVYDPKTRSMKLYFWTGHIYSYMGINENIWTQFENASSKGTWFNKVIRSGFFPYVRIK